MLVTDLPRLTYATYGDANCIKQDVRKFVDTARKLTPTKRAVYAQWFADTLAVVNAELGTSAAVALPGTKAVITSGTEVVAPVTGSGTAGVTPTIVAGAVTGWVLH